MGINVDLDPGLSRLYSRILFTNARHDVAMMRPQLHNYVVSSLLITSRSDCTPQSQKAVSAYL